MSVVSVGMAVFGQVCDFCTMGFFVRSATCVGDLFPSGVSLARTLFISCTKPSRSIDFSLRTRR